MAGIISGIATSIGVGGGTFLILFLTLFLNVEQHIAQAINLICYIPAAIVSIFYNFKKRNINFKQSYLIIISGIIGAFLGSIVSKYISVHMLNKLFGYFLLIICFYQIYDLYKFMKENK